MTRLLCSLAVLLPAPALAGDGGRPNVLFIAIDDLACALGCYGDAMARTPHIDRLASGGVRFDRAYCQVPLCNPSRASLMTGMRPDRIRVYDLDRHFRDEVPDVVTLPQRFKDAGWSAARVGKIFHYDVPAGIGTDGLDDPPSWHRAVNPAGRDREDEHLVVNAEPHRKISASLSWLAADGDDGEQTDGLVVDAAIGLMGEMDGPFFLGVGLFRPHTPYVAPRRYFDLYPIEGVRLPFAPRDDRDDLPAPAFAHNCAVPNYGLDEATCREAMRAYYACVSFVDAQVGRLLDGLGRLGLEDETIVVLWSDHGYHLGEHGGLWQKRTLFEESARAPLIIRAPGAPGNGQGCRRVVELVDLYPTLIDLAGLEVPPGLDGRSLRPLLEDPIAGWDSAAITQILRPADDRLDGPVMGRSIRTERWRYTDWAEGEGGEELYDHRGDPQEFHNLAVDPDPEASAVIGRLRDELRGKASGRVPPSPFNPSRL